ncbi:MAG: hypothetical protein ACR2PS_14730 [Pseudomonadales bacterium]
MIVEDWLKFLLNLLERLFSVLRRRREVPKPGPDEFPSDDELSLQAVNLRRHAEALVDTHKRCL